MTTLENRENTALLVIDVQVEVLQEAHERNKIVGNIKALVDSARAAGTPVIWVQHADEGLGRGTKGWEIVPELARRGSEPLVHKSYGDSFEATDLEDVLAEAGVGHLVVVGAESDACIRSTIHGAFTRGYDVTLVGDAHTASDRSQWGAPPPQAVIEHMNLYWGFQAAPGRTAAVAQAKDLVIGR